MFFNNILETIGNTPLVKLNKVCDDIPALVLGKIETFNPGHSTKDRMALKMIEDAEQRGDILPGCTIIECTSGNTGMGLAIAAVVKGYRCIFTTNDKQSKEKIDMLKAMGSEVIVCPTAVEETDPRSYYSVASRLNKEIPGSYWCNQYDNPSNTIAHYESTGPEIWNQTEGKITHLVVGVGTGGTISGVAKYLKEQNPAIQVWGVDTYGSVLKKYKETGILDNNEIYPYLTEGIGKDNLPENVHFPLIDHFEKVSDKDGAIMARRLAREEGILLGYSSGSAMQGLIQMKDKLTKDDVVVVIFHDHGSRYIAKIFNDEWMRQRGFLESELQVKDLILKKTDKAFYSVNPNDTVRAAFNRMKDLDISQMPVMVQDEMVGSISETAVLTYLLEHPGNHAKSKVKDLMSPPFPIVQEDLPCKILNRYISKKNPAVLAKDKAGNLHILTNYDLIKIM